MLEYPSGSSYAVMVKMCLASSRVRACLVQPREHKIFADEGVRSIVVTDRRKLDACLYELAHVEWLRLQPLDSSTLVYALKATSDAKEDLHTMRASQFASTNRHVYHVNLTALDCSVHHIVASKTARYLRSLDLSRLELQDHVVRSLVESAQFQNLRWLDLSGNPDITFAAVDAIAAAVHSRALPHLCWLDLLGTDCDATPYVDGYYWRITEPACHLADRYGYQQWMMLGSKIPKMANSELLTEVQRRTPPDRFNLP
jgi:hypothetical protein